MQESEADGIDRESIEAVICAYVVETSGWNGDPATLVGRDPVPIPGVLDSPALLDLVVHLEDTYDVSIADDEIIPEHFAAVWRIARLVAVKASGGSTGPGSGTP